MKTRLLLFVSTTLVSATAAPTFNHDIAPILYKNCTLCHREGEAAPFSLVTYADAKKKSATLAKAVHNRVMPPWKAKAHQKKDGDQPGWGGMRPGGSLGLGGWAVGGQPSFFPENLAIKIPAASDLVVQYHFHPTGKPEAEKSQIAFYFAKEPPKHSM